ncbi:N-alpha-acetyltransferase MAK3 isoform X2 [Populus alba]|uniref:N-alpha-acetyltransferase MAK3 isoform X2 n=1 Tax=Populus alba TaxID=43335 RepID=UPI00158A8750|nr:N-alpha-acetyltransferase MAK3-like isoform X2 [Populus alba]
MDEVQEREKKEEFDASEIEYVSYGGEHHLPLIMNLVDQELSEPYSIFTYRYFVYLWPQLSFLAFHKGKCVGTVVCKMGDHWNSTFRGYIAMLVVIKPYRGRGIGPFFVFLHLGWHLQRYVVISSEILSILQLLNLLPDLFK